MAKTFWIRKKNILLSLLIRGQKYVLIFRQHIKIITFFFIQTFPSQACIPWNLNLFNFHNILMSKESGGIISSPFYRDYPYMNFTNTHRSIFMTYLNYQHQHKSYQIIANDNLINFGSPNDTYLLYFSLF